MRIHDLDNDKALHTIGLFLTPSEAKELADTINYMLKEPDDADHEHVHGMDASGAVTHSVTVAIITDANLRMWNERSRRLIADDQ